MFLFFLSEADQSALNFNNSSIRMTVGIPSTGMSFSKTHGSE